MKAFKMRRGRFNRALLPMPLAVLSQLGIRPGRPNQGGGSPDRKAAILNTLINQHKSILVPSQYLDLLFSSVIKNKKSFF